MVYGAGMADGRLRTAARMNCVATPSNYFSAISLSCCIPVSGYGTDTHATHTDEHPRHNTFERGFVLRTQRG